MRCAVLPTALRCAVLTTLAAGAGAFHVPAAGAMRPRPTAAAAPAPRLAAPAPLRRPAAVPLRAGAPAAFFDVNDPTDLALSVAGLGLLAYFAQSGVVLLLLLLSGDPDERAESGVNDNEFLKNFALSITPSAWKKAYQGDNDVERADGTVAEKVLLDLPAWQGDEARELVEDEAVVNIRSMQRTPIDVAGVGPVETCFVSLAPQAPAADAPPVMLVHGFDSSVLEFRYIMPVLADAGLQVEAMEWWTGGFTDRQPFLTELEKEDGREPWDLIREHQFAFWKRQCNGQKVTLLGASLGGAVAMDFAVSHPECVDRLILMDAGGESYAQPDPFLTALCADPVTNLFQWRATNGLLPYPHVWANEDKWRGALRAYLKSGGYQKRVGPELIRTVPQPTLVMWGEEDDVLPVKDAYAYEKDLPDCRGVQLVPDGQHAPALENPQFVAEQIITFAKKDLGAKVPVAA